MTLDPREVVLELVRRLGVYWNHACRGEGVDEASEVVDVRVAGGVMFQERDLGIAEELAEV